VLLNTKQNFFVKNVMLFRSIQIPAKHQTFYADLFIKMQFVYVIRLPLKASFSYPRAPVCTASKDRLPWLHVGRYFIIVFSLPCARAIQLSFDPVIELTYPTLVIEFEILSEDTVDVTDDRIGTSSSQHKTSTACWARVL
jgi:hypothetical protein